MQAVILAAGRGTRMVELTTSVPKPMLEVAGRPLLEYKFEALPEEVDEVILIIGYLGNVIRSRFGARYDDRKILYVEQEEFDGTAGALWRAKEILKDRFLILMGDDIYTKEDIARCAAPSESWKLLVQELPKMHRAGSIQLDKEGRIAEIIESKSEDEARVEPGIASTNLYCVDTRLFSHALIPKHEGSLEFGLPQTVVACARDMNIRFEPVFTTEWIQITAPNDLVMAAKVVKGRERKPQ